MLKKGTICSIAFAVIIIGGFAAAQDKKPAAKTSGDRSAVDASSKDDATRDDRIPQLYRRLVAGIQSLKIQPDQEGKYVFSIKSGYQYDDLERQGYVMYKKARVYMAQNRISKIVFEYYQFGMDNKIREVKTYTNTAPDSEDLKNLEVEYTTNTGDKQAYRVADLQKRESQRTVITQYTNYLMSLVYKIELYKNKITDIESLNIERTIQLGD
ncbi:MAG: hypothetical protein A2176_07115 [Spirochaetes bacterium RBG_13_51_14]|nr:MAG: hypothetical protein A2176_07115 [Spirochaetes bacterium RBG_13_51_14]